MNRPQRTRLVVAILVGFVGVLAVSAVQAVGPDPITSMMPTTLKQTPSARIQHALDQFTDWATWVEVVSGIALAVALASLIGNHPRTRNRRELSDASEERKTLVILAVVGAVVSALVAVDQAMAFVVFGIGSLIRFRTILDNPQITGRAILVVVIGLACGLSQFVNALVVATAGWAVIYWLEAQRPAAVKIRIAAGGDRQKAQLVAADTLRRMGCRVREQKAGASGTNFTIVMSVPHAIDDEVLIKSLESTLSSEVGRAEVEFRDS
ncbi:MAG: hypothetical protein DWH97_05105 [Planctomycetota bacterium]|jgi:hypothetical protein|nr:MAG: hypothetical protein DWH97_05105 [Planctomycetota bacterium]RLS96261.1 MAG: hypothetical protein DWI12_02600 [Planctomycetota bacterium]